MIFIVILLVFISEIWDLSGQILFKKSVNKVGEPEGTTIRAYLAFIRYLLRMPAIWLGLGCVVVGIVFWFIALAQTDLSVAYPIDSMEYILTLVAARVFLGERIDRDKLIGTLLVTVGIILVSMSG